VENIMATLKVNGVRDSRPGPSELGRGLPPGAVTVKDAALLQTARAGGPQVTLEGLQPDDVVEIELQDGLRIWSRVEDVPRDLVRRSQRGQAGDTILLPSELTIGPASRALGGWTIKALKVLGLDVPGKITDFAAAHVEGRLQPGPGLYRCSLEDETGLRPASAVDGKGPVLLFLHGTASSTSGSFSELWKPQSGTLIKPLFRHYDGRVFGYQHRTLTQSPIQNALAVAEALANVLEEDGELHIVSHSRGGLVGELLAWGMRAGAAPFTPDDLSLFDEPGREADRQALERLSDVLTRTRLRVTRFVRVACPARGTTLADKRLDRYFSVLVNLASMIPGMKANPIYDGLTSLLAAVLKKRTDPGDLPGLEAMMPTSPLVRMLNNPEVRTRADLHVLGGDLAGAGSFGRLKTLVTDFYYRDDHDLVVNTPSMLGGLERVAMLGGIERVEPIRYWIDTGDKVTHFHYFARADTAGRLVSALTGSSTEFRTLEARPSAVTSADYTKRAALSQPVVVVLPGIMGSELAVADRPVWVNLLELSRGGLSLLGPAADRVKATGLLSIGYAALCAHLAQTHKVEPFPYDWRRPIEESAQELQKFLDQIVPVAEIANQPVRLLAHSMGGLVVRAMLATGPGQRTWERMCRHPGARFIMLGTPNAGSHAIPAMLIGREALVRNLALVDLRNDHAGLMSTIAGFDGVLNMLPHAGTLDLFDHAAWNRLLELDAPETRGLFGSGVESSRSAGFRWTVPAQAALDRARKVAALVRDSPLDLSRVVYVAGVADETACDLVIDEQALPGRRVKVMASARGDGRVLWETGVPRGIRSFYMDASHGDLANDPRHFPALVDLLHTGSTSKLRTTAPLRREADEQFELRDFVPAMVPDEAELVAGALGGRRVDPEAKRPQTRISIRIVHDNLINARYPVLASHYKNDVIVAAEGYLDGRLKGRLSELLRMELYPGPLNTGVVVLNDPAAGDLSIHPGAIIAGLGIVGELTPGSLTATLAHALTLYGAECVGRERRRLQRAGDLQVGGSVPAPVTAILNGSGEGGVSLADSVQALLRAVLQANQRLRPSDRDAAGHGDSPPLSAQINRIEILELYEDRAIEALHTLRQLSQSPEFEGFIVQELLARGDDGRRRARFDQAVGWWQRIRVTSTEQGALQFEAVTQTARAPARLRPTQRALVDDFVQQAIETTSNDPKLGHTLFELLVPNEFKSYAPDQRKLALMLNPAAAAIPWELMHDRFGRSPEPLSVSSGMIRQLLLVDERAHVQRAPDNTALVIGNPIVSDPRFASLPGAAAEATSVAGVLTDVGGYEVQLLLEEAAHPMAVLSAIHEKPWRILHLAAHGVFEFDAAAGKEPVSGLVLDNGMFFTAAEADQLRYVPELVFINCCHLGQTSGETSQRAAFHKLAANLATQFIGMGVRAVVAAGWAVDDAAAKTFALALYRRLLQGELFGEAVAQARRETYMCHGETNTWGAYQCYGDPSFRLSVVASRPRENVFVSDRELSIWLDSLAAQARQNEVSDDSLVSQLEKQEAQTPVAWWDSADLCARAAHAFAELSRFERAIYYYERVLRAEPANAPIRALEQLVNCKVRWAATLVGPDGSDVEKATALLDDAERILHHLMDLSATSERWSLLGGLMKRRAMVTRDPKARRKALERMSEAYKRAYDISRQRGTADAYPLGNQIAADVVLSWRTNGTRRRAAAGVSASLKELETLASELGGSRTDVFSLSAAADRLLLHALLKRELDEKTCAGVLERLLSALSRGATARQRDSMRTQFHFFRRLMETDFPEARREATIRQIMLLEEKVLGPAPRGT
jgi:pimeloyl-ACP methyl ester carboxylesterase/tetratricopeptide (TPR) repeat protein